MRRMMWTPAMMIVSVMVAGGASLRADQLAAGETKAQRCGPRTLKGTWAIQIEGTRPAPGGVIESVVGVVIRKYDGEGSFTQIDNVKGSVTGIVADREGGGVYEVRPDCTGLSIVEPVPGIVIEERLVIFDQGRQAVSITAAPQPVMVKGRHHRIH